MFDNKTLILKSLSENRSPLHPLNTPLKVLLLKDKTYFASKCVKNLMKDDLTNPNVLFTEFFLESKNKRGSTQVLLFIRIVFSVVYTFVFFWECLLLFFQ